LSGKIKRFVPATIAAFHVIWMEFDGSVQHLALYRNNWNQQEAEQKKPSDEPGIHTAT